MEVNRRDIRPTSGNIHTKGAQTWTPEKENKEKRRESFILKQKRLKVMKSKLRQMIYMWEKRAPGSWRTKD
jgi:hypothetical protein